MIYFDLDNFKAYNDIYGFLNGDEIIKFTARTIIKNIHMSTNEEKFVGHIGGDDFVAIVGGMECEQICQNIVAEFDREVVKYFTPEDVEKGYLEVPNRKGIIEQYPITTISVSAVVVDAGRFHNALEIGEVAAQVKHLAKITPGSTYVIDRRKKWKKNDSNFLSHSFKLYFFFNCSNSSFETHKSRSPTISLNPYSNIDPLDKI